MELSESETNMRWPRRGDSDSSGVLAGVLTGLDRRDVEWTGVACSMGSLGSLETLETLESLESLGSGVLGLSGPGVVWRTQFSTALLRLSFMGMARERSIVRYCGGGLGYASPMKVEGWKGGRMEGWIENCCERWKFLDVKRMRQKGWERENGTKRKRGVAWVERSSGSAAGNRRGQQECW